VNNTASINVSDVTTPADALRLAYERGTLLQRDLGDAFEFSQTLAVEVNLPYGHSALLPFLRIGFAAGYFGQPFPNIERILARQAPRRTVTSVARA
jgi:hypothetical protein